MKRRDRVIGQATLSPNRAPVPALSLAPEPAAMRERRATASRLPDARLRPEAAREARDRLHRFGCLASAGARRRKESPVCCPASALAAYRCFFLAEFDQMKIARARCAMWVLGAALALTTAAEAAAAPVKRCGWLENPTPANWWLVDKDGSWTLSTMGNEPVPGLDEMPDMSTQGWVVTNAGEHGYGCACLDLEIDPHSREVTRIVAAKPLPLKRCKADKTLPAP
ncbi:DUF4087 domain-containing protein [Burkholderia sp. BCC1972]|uniref:DUF4087 domain-containing protein n=1 Tax=Burkholderia sp. BCC1972 TaxID=2817438 RepID=UPI002ABE0480|nr:DUF4087 domain-containing protein [Burkholderia sp. BCC1972]